MRSEPLGFRMNLVRRSPNIWDHQWRWGEWYPITEWGQSFLHARSDAQLLDIGCGGGATLNRLLALAPEGMITGMDYSETSVQKSGVCSAASIREGKVSVIQGSVSDMPFSRDVFDGITTVESFYFWPDPQNDLREVLRVLRPDASFLLIADMIALAFQAYT